MVLKVRRLVRWFLPFYLLTLLPFNASAATKAQADSAYAQGHFQQAIADYEALLKQGASADLYYNLGNAYYRSENITQAVLNYEPACRSVARRLLSSATSMRATTSSTRCR